jgi:sulfur carrier protein
MISIEFNGKETQIDDSTTVAELLEQSKVASKFCAVELNLEIVPKPLYGTRLLNAGDKIEVVTLVGGG